jgi:SAM-dependent methyltransferase
MRDDHRETNRRNWDERAGIHARSRMYDLDGFIAQPDKLWLHPAEPGELGDVRGRSLCHLQCHLGLETLSWARLGARHCVGLDFSPRAIELARGVAERCGLAQQVRFVESDVHDARAVLAADAPFDIVYVSIGAICWLPSITRWASIVADLLVPGGVLYMRETHPMLQAIAERDGQFMVDGPYFETPEPTNWNIPETYTEGKPRLENPSCYEWSHSISEILNALRAQHLSLELFEEHREAPFQPFASMTENAGTFRLPPPLCDRIPLTFSLRARKCS